jgi:antitoxin component of MazEF toxin-antitoxin module
MRSRIVKIGISQGIRIPKALLEQARLDSRPTAGLLT